MDKKPLKSQIKSILRWVGWVLLVQFVLINISAALYAFKLTHFYNNHSEESLSESGNIFTKSWKLFTGPHYGKSVITEVPVFRHDTVTLETKKGIRIDAWYGKTDSVSKGTVILFHGIGVSKSVLM